MLDCLQLSRGNSQLSPPVGLQLAMLMQAHLAAVQIFSWGSGPGGDPQGRQVSRAGGGGRQASPRESWPGCSQPVRPGPALPGGSQLQDCPATPVTHLPACPPCIHETPVVHLSCTGSAPGDNLKGEAVSEPG